MTAKVKKIMEIPLFRRLREYVRKDGLILVVTPILNFLQNSILKVNTVRGMICTEILFFSNLELRKHYFLTITYLKTKAL